MSNKKGIGLADPTPYRGNSILNAALAYSQMLDWPVFPLSPKGKEPIHKGGFHNATTNREQIIAWWSEYPKANIGLPTGDKSGVIVLDVDPRNQGHISLERLKKEFGELPHTVECLTGGGGNHFYFKYDKKIKKTKLEGYPGIDVQHNGKYVVLPPSTHPNGNKYEWAANSKPVLTPIGDLPTYLLNMVIAKTSSEGHRKPTEEYLRILRGVAEGERNNSLMTIIGHLLAKGIDYRIAYELVLAWNESRAYPPLDEDTVTRAFNNILRKEAEKWG